MLTPRQRSARPSKLGKRRPTATTTNPRPTKAASNSSRSCSACLARYHNYEFASAAFQIGIVLASATIITGMMVLTWISVALGAAGLALMAFGLWMPHALDFLTHASH